MRVVRGRKHDAKVEQFSGTFTGVIWGDPIVPPSDGVAVTSVLFTPGARTFWHRHERGQVLYVTGGGGLVCARGEAAQAIRAGDTIWTSPGEEHWHGAGPASYLMHIAISLGDTEWLEEVAEDR
jgi:quercetin dioxygenase-like cupin family protein